MLASVKHVGPSGAAFLLERHGTEVLELVDADPRLALRAVPGIGPARIGAATRSWERLRGRRALRLFLAEHGVPAAAAARIERALGPRRSTSCAPTRTRPREVDGVGFATADALARALGLPERRARADRGRARSRAARGRARRALPAAARRARAPRRAACWASTRRERIDELVALGRLVADGEMVADPVMDASSGALARRARELATSGPAAAAAPDRAPASGEFVPTDAQWAVVDAVLGGRLAILTGGPGTGKTATMRALVDLVRSNARTVRLCAPTGKAARQLTEATGAPATTIHRLLEWIPGEGFARGPEDPIDGTDVLVVDEASMLSAVARRRAARRGRPAHARAARRRHRPARRPSAPGACSRT